MTPRRIDGIAIGAAFAAALFSYARSAPWNVGAGDTAEQQTVPYILGIAHPTGFPLFTLAGWAFTHLVPVSTVAWRMNVLCGVCVAAATAAGVAIALLLRAPAPAALFGGLAFAWSGIAWEKGTHADPHALSFAFIAGTLLFALRWVRDGRGGDLVAAALCDGLGVATHPDAVWAFPAIVVAVLVRRPRALRPVVLAGAALIVPVAFYAYLPLRSAYVGAHGLDPDAAAPVFVDSIWDSNRPRTWHGFVVEVSGSQFGAVDDVRAVLDVRSYPAAIAYWWQRSRASVPLVVFVLALLGAAAAARDDLRTLVVLAAGTLGTIPFLYAYSPVESDVDRYLLPSLLVVCALAATAGRLVGGRGAILGAALVTVVLAGVAAVQYDANARRIADRNDPAGQGAIDAVARETPDGAIVVAYWLDATSLAYGAYVEHRLGSRIIVSGWPGEFAGRYRAWSKARPVVIFAAGSALDNARTSVPKALIAADVPSADGYHHLLEIRPCCR